MRDDSGIASELDKLRDGAPLILSSASPLDSARGLRQHSRQTVWSPETGLPYRVAFCGGGMDAVCGVRFVSCFGAI